MLTPRKAGGMLASDGETRNEEFFDTKRVLKLRTTGPVQLVAATPRSADVPRSVSFTRALLSTRELVTSAKKPVVPISSFWDAAPELTRPSRATGPVPEDCVCSHRLFPETINFT